MINNYYKLIYAEIPIILTYLGNVNIIDTNDLFLMIVTELIDYLPTK